MSGVIIAFLSIISLLTGYKFYGRKIEKLFDVNPNNKTPSYYNYDGIDYIPAKNWLILFGHHFASIAGAGPILGPVIACFYFGWLPGILWIVLGTIFIGGVHDLSSLLASIREGGKSIGEVANKVMGKRVKILFSIFVWFALILVVSVFAAATAKTLISEPKIVIPTFSLILIAIFTGILIYRVKFNQFLATIIGIALLVFSIYLGNKFPVSLNLNNPLKIWILILLLYAGIASIIPVNILLQPRDYLSSFILFFSLIYGLIGLILTNPKIQSPAFTKFSTENGPLWPMMFVIIACGAISGFHSLISSGTTSKQIENEKHAKIIGYGAMVLEAVLATVALLSVCAGLSRVEYGIFLKEKGWIVTFANGFGKITERLLENKIGFTIAVISLNAFVMTTLDSATRITRYITEEIFGDSFGVKIFKKRVISTLLILLLALSLAFGSWQKIWPIFGASNQLVAALVLIIVSCFLLSKGKKIKFTLIPAIFMLLTTISALLLKIKDFYISKNFTLFIVGILLILLAIFVVYEAIRFFKKSHVKFQ